MVRLAWLIAACAVTATTGVAHAATESEAARVRVVLRVHEHGKSVSDTLGDVWDSVKNETSEAIESVAEELHDALYGSGNGPEEGASLEVVVVEETVRKNKVVKSMTTVHHAKSELEDLAQDLENAIFGSTSGSSSRSGSGSGKHESVDVGDEGEEESGEEEEESEEEEETDTKTHPPLKKHHKKTKNHEVKKHHHARKQHKKEEVKAAASKETATMANASEERRPRATAFALIGAAVGAMVGVVALAVFVAVRRRRDVSTASVLAEHESDVEAVAPKEEEESEEDVEAAAADNLEKVAGMDDIKLEGSV